MESDNNHEQQVARHSSWAASVLLICAAITAFAFARSAFVHIANPYQFLRSIDGYRLLPMTITPYLAYTIPVLQMFLSLGLMFGELKRYAIASASLLLLFSVAQGSAIFRGIDLSCGCFSSSGGDRIGLATLSVPLGLGLTLLTAVVSQRRALKGSFQQILHMKFAFRKESATRNRK